MPITDIDIHSIIIQMSTSCSLKYHVTGIKNADSTTTQSDVCDEIREVLESYESVSAKPIDTGLELEITVNDIEPFTRKEFEAYIYEHVVWHAVMACCEISGDKIAFQLISSKYVWPITDCQFQSNLTLSER